MSPPCAVSSRGKDTHQAALCPLQVYVDHFRYNIFDEDIPKSAWRQGAGTKCAGTVSRNDSALSDGGGTAKAAGIQVRITESHPATRNPSCFRLAWDRPGLNGRLGTQAGTGSGGAGRLFASLDVEHEFTPPRDVTDAGDPCQADPGAPWAWGKAGAWHRRVALGRGVPCDGRGRRHQPCQGPDVGPGQGADIRPGRRLSSRPESRAGPPVVNSWYLVAFVPPEAEHCIGTGATEKSLLFPSRIVVLPQCVEGGMIGRQTGAIGTSITRFVDGGALWSRKVNKIIYLRTLQMPRQLFIKQRSVQNHCRIGVVGLLGQPMRQ